LATASELKMLAIERLTEAQLLCDNRFYTGAYYLSGYAIEFGLKAVICKKLAIEIFDKQVVSGNILKAFQIHDLTDLIILAGLNQQLETLISEDIVFSKNWSVVSAWNEQRRYDFGCNSQTAQRFLVSVNKILIWIQQHW
jgi:HEPN domain-containing protein